MHRKTAAGLFAVTVNLMTITPLFAQSDTPAGFEVSTVATGLSEPIALAAASDGRVFIGERGGTIRVLQDGALRDEPFAEIPVFTGGECGLLGFALDPDFESNGHLFMFVSVSSNEQQIMRITDVDGVGTNLVTIRGNLPTVGANHNGGAIAFGPDGHIYFAIGDNGQPPLSADLTSLAGKVCRITRDGDTPDDNPFTTPTGSPRAIFALGFRNPFRMCFDAAGRLFVVDVGSSDEARREEVNLVTAGGDHGWPTLEGVGGTAQGFVDPIVAYHDEGASITGIVSYSGDQFPEEFRGNLFHLDYVSNGLFRTVLDGDLAASHDIFLTFDSAPVELVASPDGSLYASLIFAGELKRIRYTLGASVDDPVDDPDDGNTDDGSGVVAPPPGGPLCGLGLIPVLLIAPLLCVQRKLRRRK